MCLADTVEHPGFLRKKWQIPTLLLGRQIFLSLNSANSGKTFRENSIVSSRVDVEYSRRRAPVWSVRGLYLPPDRSVSGAEECSRSSGEAGPDMRHAPTGSKKK